MGIDVASIISDVVGNSFGAAFKEIVSAFKADPTVALQNETQLEQLRLQLQGKMIDQITSQIQGQLAIDQTEAASKSLFVAGWRPWAGWICATTLLVPAVVYLAQATMMLIHGQYNVPAPNTTDLTTTLFGLLGLGGMRSYDKSQGTGSGQ